MKRITKETALKIEEFKNARNVVENFNDSLLKIIQDTYDSTADEIINVDFDYHDWFGDKNLIEVCYGFGDGYGSETVGIPYPWLNEGFDYKANYKHRLEVIKERKRRLAAVECKKKEIARAQKEREEYERLKKKFKE